ncbi:MAG: hypothetical protein HY000_14460 [Planctomycetes bacterium]|nr:hypothetical protein [Planctomycetota bacterium]
MPVNRAARDELFQVIGAYMKGEIRSFEFDDRIWNAYRTDDESAKRVSSILWHYYDDCIDHPISAPPEVWDYFRRILAFLKTDLELETLSQKTWRPGSRYAALGLGLMALAALISYATASALPLAAVYVLVGLGWLFVKPVPVLNPLYRLFPCAPFRDEATWRSYEVLAEERDLPLYDPTVHGKPVRSARSRRWLSIQQYVLAMLFLPVALPVILLCALPRKTWRIELAKLPETSRQLNPV